MDVFITGGTGFIGAELCRVLLQRGDRVTVLSRDPAAARRRLGSEVKLVASSSVLAHTPFDAVVNLAGLPIADRRWSESRKRALLASRVGVTDALVQAMAQAGTRPRVLVSGSAIGYYGDRGNRLVDERSAPQQEFTHTLCYQWEQAAQRAEPLGVRVCLLRIGLVVGSDGGFLKRMLPAFRAGLGGPLGDGEQWMSWVHRHDLVRMILYLIDRDTLQGPFNGTAPRPVRNSEFTCTLGRVLNRPVRMRVPEFALRAALGEMSRLLLTGQRVIPVRLLEAGFEFDFERLDAALRDVVT